MGFAEKVQVVVHNAAVEYHESILEAIGICDLAEKELELCHNVSNRMPGTFNMACSTIYGGWYEGIGDTMAWKSPINRDVGYDQETAKQLVSVGVSKIGSPDQKAHGIDREVVRRDYMSLEVIKILMPEPEPAYPDGEDKLLPENKYFRRSQTLGKLIAKPWIPEDPLDEDRELLADQHEEIEIVLEKGLLQFCFTGMHLEARVHRCDDGLVFIDSVTVS